MASKLSFLYRYFKAFSDKKYIDKIRSIMQLLVPKVPADSKFVRVGRDYDGGYVMLDEFGKAKVAYSIGISNDISWDQDIAKRGLDVFMYDHTIAPLQVEGRLKFFKLGVCGENCNNKNLLTLEEMLKKDNNLGKDIVLKIDVEGAEWDVFSQIPDEILKSFSQIVIELHWLTKALKNEQRYQKVIKALQNLNKYHQVVHVHANNFSPYEIIGGMPFADALEVAYVRKEGHEFLNRQSPEALALDMPCYRRHPDYCLSFDAFRTYK